MTQTNDDIVNEAMRQWADSRVNTPLHKIIHNAVTAARLDERRRCADRLEVMMRDQEYFPQQIHKFVETVFNAPSDQSGEDDWLRKIADEYCRDGKNNPINQS